MPSWLVQGVITSLLGAMIGFFAHRIWDFFFLFRKSEYSGIWEDEILNKGNVEKRDRYKIRHNRRTNELTGTISRIYPADQTYRKWKMVGRLEGDGYILFTFWSVVSTHKSRGAVYLRHTKDNVFEGYYLEDHKDGKIDKTSIRFIKKA